MYILLVIAVPLAVDHVPSIPTSNYRCLRRVCNAGVREDGAVHHVTSPFVTVLAEVEIGDLDIGVVIHVGQSLHGSAWLAYRDDAWR